MKSAGARVRSLRLKRGWTLKDLGGRCDISPSFLSLFERGLSSVSIVVLGKICGALDTSLGELFVGLDEDPVCSAVGASSATVYHEHDGVIVDDKQIALALNASSEAIRYRLLGRNFPGRQYEIILGEISPGFLVSASLHGGEEFGYVLEGQLELTVGEQTHTLGPGESFQFDARTCHSYRALGSAAVKLLWVQSVLKDQLPKESQRFTPNG